MSPPIDHRDGYRQEVDRAVVQCGYDRARAWTDEEVRKAKRICYRTVWTESDWRNLANRSVPESINVLPNDGYGADLDSTGLYQQRSSQGWGTVIGSMDPYTATSRFLNEMLNLVPDWFDRNEPDVCQRVQRSQFDGVTIDPHTGFPYPYAVNYAARQSQTDALEANPLFFTEGG